MAIFGAQWASTLVELPTLTFHHAILPLSIFSALHGIRVSMAYRQAIEQAAAQSLRDGKGPQPTRLPWGQALLSVLAMSLGGGFSASMLLGMPPSWLGSNVVVPTYTLSFFLIQYTYLYDILKDMVPPAVLDSVLIVADGSLRALSIAKLGVDGSRMRFAADSHYPGATEPWFAMLLLGMISGSGGGMWGDFLKLKTHKWTLSTPSWASAATYDMKAALLSAFFYAASTSPQFYSLLHNDKDGGFVAHGGMLETQDAKAMTMLVMCTLLLGKRAEETVVQLTKSFQSNATTTAIPPRKSLRSSSTAASRKKRDDEIEEDDDEESERHEMKGLGRDNRDDESSYKPLTRRGFDDATEEEEEEEEDEEQEVKKSTRRGGRKKSSTTRTTTTTTSRRSAKSASVEPSSSEVPLTRSTRLRKPTRQEL